MHRYLKCNWQLEQPKIVDKWLVSLPQWLVRLPQWLAVNTCMSDEEAQATMAATMRLQMKRSPRFEIPVVHNVSFWELPHSHPIFHIDDSLAQYPPAPRSDKFPPSASATPDTSPQRPVAHPKPNQEGSSEALRNGSSSAGAPTTPRGGAQMPIQRTVTPPTVNSSGQSAGRKGRSTIHAIIFVHGFQGSSTDMCLIKGNLSLLYPNMECYSSRCNEENTSESLQEMGSKLACEVADYLKPHASSTRRPLVALSFVGHSLGNLIIRSALTCQELKPFLHLLHLYVSLSGPHLGNLYSTNTVLDTGISVLKSVSGKGKCLHQLSFTDASNIQDCFLYRLAQKSRLADFKYIMLVTSPQDRYVPYHSARLSKCLAAVKDPKRGPAYNAMLKMLLQDVGEPDHAQLIRIDVDFDFKK
ncbi:hypothetical protein CEUSTIGMA_g6864.t1 [Chlamydomonas eustigma]|uniref:DUF676 domain-containing protein n=1 Tax=Chlamydomonas eustigma TaxID=1157962 RepID=A0A250X8L9_9CHLO|nr:hypothetical protein CEUSTIGMA_g6864.t1 [Chlamydomonas eustigma]|eukprot:GAX79423.1 hypothetical protein CEUSTIGMA_g6864.t1 [Chlamydomonas eustigma]